jgi:hypothetical protein
MSSATPTHAGPASEFLFLLCTFWRHGASPHNPAATPDTAPSRHCARSQGRNKPHQGRPSTGQETRLELHRLAEPKRWDTAQSPGAGAPASQATANFPGRLALRSHNDAAGSTRDGVTTTSQRQAGRVMECTALLHGSSCAVCNKPGWVRTAQSLILKRARQ